MEEDDAQYMWPLRYHSTVGMRLVRKEQFPMTVANTDVYGYYS